MVYVKNRIRWVDQWRGIAVIFMIIYHIPYDLNYLGICFTDLTAPFWFFMGHLIRWSFLLIVGISLYLSYKKHTGKGESFGFYLKHHLVRAIKLFLIALGITAVSFLLDRDYTIYFGILHLISVGIILGALTIRSALLPIILGLISFGLGPQMAQISSSNLFLLPLGIAPAGMKSFDFFPIFPWVGFIFFGIAFAHFLGRTGCLMQPISWPRANYLEFIGRHALLIYLIHQPILLWGMWIFLIK